MPHLLVWTCCAEAEDPESPEVLQRWLRHHWQRLLRQWGALSQAWSTNFDMQHCLCIGSGNLLGPVSLEVHLTRLLKLAAMQVVLKYDAGRGPITALAVTAEDCILAGTQDGCMMVFAPDSRRHITRCSIILIFMFWPASARSGQM